MKLTQEEAVKRMKAWAMENYENGADTFVECWETSDYVELFNEHGGVLGECMKTLKRMASVYRERQADAEYHRSQA